MAIVEVLKKSMESIEKSLKLLDEREALFRIAESRGEDRTAERIALAETKEKLLKEGAQTMTELEKFTKEEESQHERSDE